LKKNLFLYDLTRMKEGEGRRMRMKDELGFTPLPF